MTQETPRIAVITGSSRGIGRAAAERLARDGFFVVVTYARNEAAGQQALESIRASGGDGLALRAEISTLAGIEDFYARLDAKLGERFGSKNFDVLVNNAGIIADQVIGASDEETFDNLFNLNAKGAFFTTKAALDGRLRDGGRIIFVGTGLTRFSVPQYVAYSMTKGAIDVLTRVLANELGPRGITVNEVAPGAIVTDMNPGLRTEEGAAYIGSLTALGRPGEPEDISRVISFLASDDAGWVTAQRLEASGGMNL